MVAPVRRRGGYRKSSVSCKKRCSSEISMRCSYSGSRCVPRGTGGLAALPGVLGRA